MQHPQHQRGSTAIGFIVGVLTGLAIALVVALVINRAARPFVDRDITPATPATYQNEAERNRNWNPNASLDPGHLPSSSAPTAQTSHPGAAASSGTAAAPAASTPASAEAHATSSLGSTAADTTQPSTLISPDASTAGPHYFVQAGAFQSQKDADAQRAQIAMMGWEARVSEREQNGRTIFRVRIGPFGKRADAELFQQQLNDQGIATTIVRTQP